MAMLIRELYKTIKTIIPTMTVTNWAGFGNQPDGDGVEIISNSASDVGKCTIWGSDKTTGALCGETVTLTGTDAVSTVKVNWDDIYAVFLGDKDGTDITPAVGTITVREASGNAAITTLTTGTLQKGMLVLETPGVNVEIWNAGGKIYINTVELATAANGLYDVGTSANVFKYSTSNKLHIISDNTGCAVQVAVLED